MTRLAARSDVQKRIGRRSSKKRAELGPKQLGIFLDSCQKISTNYEKKDFSPIFVMMEPLMVRKTAYIFAVLSRAESFSVRAKKG